MEKVKYVKQEQRKWEKAFKKKMSENEKTMFVWGLIYGMERMDDEIKNK